MHKVNSLDKVPGERTADNMAMACLRPTFFLPLPVAGATAALSVAMFHSYIRNLDINTLKLCGKCTKFLLMKEMQKSMPTPLMRRQWQPTLSSTKIAIYKDPIQS